MIRTSFAALGLIDEDATPRLSISRTTADCDTTGTLHVRLDAFAGVPAHPRTLLRSFPSSFRWSMSGSPTRRLAVSSASFSPHISPGEICAASKFLLERNLARPTGKNEKTKVVVPFFRRG
jgi:hypothetical protein